MKLNYRSSGAGGRVLVMLHGLFGSSSNWQSIAKELGKEMTVLVPDLRNHGNSPHSTEAGFESMAGDVGEFLDDLGIGEADIAGHSLGGKVAMVFALTRPDRVRRLAVVDIAPRGYPPYHRDILDALLALGLPASREEADRVLASAVPDAPTRVFLLSNLVRDGDRYRFRMNIGALSASYAELCAWPDRDWNPFPKPALFIRGGESGYMSDGDISSLRRLFPESRLAVIPGASHWVHADRPAEFLSVLRSFLLEDR